MHCKLGMMIVLLLVGTVLAQSKATDTLDFSVGIFSAGNPTDENFRYIKLLGVDYVHQYSLAGNNTKEYIQRYMDTAAKYDMKVMLDVSNPLRNLNAGKITEQQAIEQFTAIIKRWKDHKALGFWYIYDEPHQLRRVNLLCWKELQLGACGSALNSMLKYPLCI